jgi:hypothetical protein
MLALLLGAGTLLVGTVGLIMFLGAMALRIIHSVLALYPPLCLGYMKITKIL